MKLNSYIDHSLLKPTALRADIVQLCIEAVDFQFPAVCIAPYFVELASKKLKDTEVRISTVIGFPLGYDHLSTKIGAINKAMDHGADDLDVVVNIAAVKNKEWNIVEKEIDTICTILDKRSDKVLKLIMETAYLTFEEIEILCNLCLQYNVAFAKTSTGFGPEGATVEHVAFIHSILNGKIGIKASGGIRDRRSAEALVKAGATRLGTSAGIQIVS